MSEIVYLLRDRCISDMDQKLAIWYYRVVGDQIVWCLFAEQTGLDFDPCMTGRAPRAQS